MIYILGDDSTRTFRATDENNNLLPPEEVGWTVNPRPYTSEENAAADATITDAATLTDLAARVARIEALLWPAAPDPSDPEDPSVGTWESYAGVWPNQGLLLEVDTVWRNISGVPLTTPPSGFPGTPAQWTHLFVAALEPAPGPSPWFQPTGAHDDYDLNALVTHLGSTWISTVSNNVWEPGVYGWSIVP